MHLRSSPEWVVRCWDGLLPTGRNVRVSMMVECFWYIYMFFTNVSWSWVTMSWYLLVFWCWCVLFFCLVSRVEFLWLLGCGWFVALRSLVGGDVALLHCFQCCLFVCLFLLYQLSFAVLILSSLL